MNDDIERLARGCNFIPPAPSCPAYYWSAEIEDIERFYRAAYRAGMERAAAICDEEAELSDMNGLERIARAKARCAQRIRAAAEKEE